MPFTTLERKAELLDHLWENSLIGLAIVAKDGTFLKANPAFCKITEYTEVELQSRTFQDITHPADNQADTQMASQVASLERRSYDMKKRYVTKTNRVVWIVLRVVPVKNGDHFEVFLSQATPVVELMPPKDDIKYNSGNVDPVKLVTQFVKDYWKPLAIVFGSVAYLAAELIKYLYKIGIL